MILSENFATFRKLCTGGAAPLCHLDYGIELSPQPVLPRLAPTLRFWAMPIQSGILQGFEFA
jgi:hypothetical protein